ncbi:hypothetical protein SAMN05421820_115110 [Pedobacter steynii]|uniref:Uncharacterized protein n=1 Tax=Pedobacter steynii TaxID=430522 RepID=A0A1H0JYK4_9SPHI|nr:hypothetical protein [Pedobacter steynii]NQX43194.1 hypothetical protein [Pedobacter steynii]SDO48491.1 hypothetical protein SAMN05421820_115110 [Pedobacter steynii]
MFGFFKNKYDNPALLEEIRQTEEKWFVFLDKLETRLEELCAAAIPELIAVFNQDTDPYKRAHSRMLTGLIGQISQMQQKGIEAKETHIIPFMQPSGSLLPDLMSSAGRKYHDRLYRFQMACFDRHHQFEDKVNEGIAALRAAKGNTDLEGAYQRQLTEFERIKDNFNCKQCGGKMSLPKMFFIATYIQCPFCQSQNTYTPSTEMQMLFHQARSLAEQRTAHLLQDYENSKPKNPALYQQYLRAMFDEWNKITPDMLTENERFYQRLLKDHSINHY